MLHATMLPRPSWPSLLVLWLLLLPASLTSAGCGDDDGPSTPPDGSYDVAGVVESLPRDGADRREMTVAHEEIPDFVGRDGQEVGMEAMTMQFVVAQDVDLEGVAVGDGVDLTFEVRWNDRPMLLITRLEEK